VRIQQRNFSSVEVYSLASTLYTWNFGESKMGKAYLLAACLLLFTCSYASYAQARTDRAEASSSSPGIVYQDWQDAKRGRDIPIKIYLPKSGSAPYPVVIFSHGLGGSREAAVYLGEYWSQHGYLGVFVQHPGSDTGVLQGSMGQGRQALIERMQSAANAKNLIERVQDIKFALDELERRNQSDPVLKNQLDLGKVALAGHSFGAGTTLAIAGQNYGEAGKNLETKDKRVKAAIYLCPPVINKSAPDQTYGNIQIPGLLVTGTEDNSAIRDTKAEDRRIPFDGMKSPHQYLVNFVGADHGTFGGRSFRAPKDGDEKFHEMTDKVTTEFLDATLKGDASAWHWLDSAEVTNYLGKTAMFERK
jgi:predicted dienelactone hydrolase